MTEIDDVADVTDGVDVADVIEGEKLSHQRN
jgi:hypothetical protein